MKFKALRFLAMLQIVLGTVALLAALFVFVILAKSLADSSGQTDPLVSSITGGLGFTFVVALALGGLVLIGQGEFLQVIMQIEENTRPPKLPEDFDETVPGETEKPAAASK